MNVVPFDSVGKCMAVQRGLMAPVPEHGGGNQRSLIETEKQPDYAVERSDYAGSCAFSAQVWLVLRQTTAAFKRNRFWTKKQENLLERVVSIQTSFNSTEFEWMQSQSLLNLLFGKQIEHLTKQQVKHFTAELFYA